MFGLQFHWYGFLIGLGVLAGLTVTESLLKKKQFPLEIFWRVIGVVGVGGVIGARAWHVATDVHLYVGHWVQALAIWQGGLSIIGAVVGGLLAMFIVFQLRPAWKKYQLILLDAAAIGLPIGQAIGRLGNFVNQELYGLPTNLPWAIYIDPTHRLAGFAQFSTYHPLFAYEAIALLLFVGMAWKLKACVYPLGSGRLFLCYIAYYSWLRFDLDFLRIDKAISPVFGLGINQVFLLVVGVVASCFLLHKMIHNNNLKSDQLHGD